MSMQMNFFTWLFLRWEIINKAKVVRDSNMMDEDLVSNGANEEIYSRLISIQLLELHD